MSETAACLTRYVSSEKIAALSLKMLYCCFHLIDLPAGITDEKAETYQVGERSLMGQCPL